MMDKYGFYECVGMVRDFFIEEAMDWKQSVRDRIITKRSLVAACVCLFAVTALFAVYVNRDPAGVDPPIPPVSSIDETHKTETTTEPEPFTDTSADTTDMTETTAPIRDDTDTSSWQDILSRPLTGPWRSIWNWTKVIATLGGIAAACVLAGKSLKYIRAVWKRFTLMSRLRSICRKKGYKLKKLSSCYRSIFTVTDSPEILITTPQEKYEIKLFTCLRYRDTYTLADIDHFTTQSNANMILLGNPTYPSGMNPKNVDHSLIMPRFHRDRRDVIKEVTIEGADKKPAEANTDATKILCLNPISIEVRRVEKSRTEQVFDGDELGGYRVYSGTGLCRLLK